MAMGFYNESIGGEWMTIDHNMFFSHVENQHFVEPKRHLTLPSMEGTQSSPP